MKRILSIVIVVVAFAMMAGSAQADRYSDPTCGQNNPSGNGIGPGATILQYDGFGNGWDIIWGEHCGSGGTVSTEIQQSVSGGAWTDMANTEAAFTVVHGSTWETRDHHYDWPNVAACNPTNHRYRGVAWADQNAQYPVDVSSIVTC